MRGDLGNSASLLRIFYNVYEFGIRTREKLLAEGIAASTIDNRCRRGTYHRLLPAVYCITDPTPLARCAAVLAWEPRAVLSHRTAAWLWQMWPVPDVLEATVPRDLARRSPPGLRLYRRRLDALDVTEAWDLPAVGPEQALVDCLSVLDSADADRLVDEHLTRTVSIEGMGLLRKKYPGRWGNGDVLRQLRSAAVSAASEPERLLAREFARRNYAIEANAPIGPWIVDFYDRRASMVVEVDGLRVPQRPVGVPPRPAPPELVGDAQPAGAALCRGGRVRIGVGRRGRGHRQRASTPQGAGLRSHAGPTSPGSLQFVPGVCHQAHAGGCRQPARSPTSCASPSRSCSHIQRVLRHATNSSILAAAFPIAMTPSTISFSLAVTSPNTGAAGTDEFLRHP